MSTITMLPESLIFLSVNHVSNVDPHTLSLALSVSVSLPLSLSLSLSLKRFRCVDFEIFEGPSAL